MTHTENLSKASLLIKKRGLINIMKHIQKLNNWLAVKITNGIGTMWCAYIFALITFISLPSSISLSFANHHFNSIPIVSWIAQTFLQLVLLSVIMVGQNVQSAKHDDVLKNIKKIHKHLGIKEPK